MEFLFPNDHLLHWWIVNLFIVIFDIGFLMNQRYEIGKLRGLLVFHWEQSKSSLRIRDELAKIVRILNFLDFVVGIILYIIRARFGSSNSSRGCHQITEGSLSPVDIVGLLFDCYWSCYCVFVLKVLGYCCCFNQIWGKGREFRFGLVYWAR